MMRSLLFSLALLALATTVARAAERPGTEPPIGPSENKGRTGVYHVSTRIAGYNYYVCVPSSYDDAHPAGLHLFFHGQNNQGAAKDWDRWRKYFLEPFTLIGINMEYTDGDNGRDTAGKVKAAQLAIAQVCADYKVVVPRGMVSCFSGGGAVHGLMGDMHGKVRSPQWPFCMSTLYSANFSADPTAMVPMSWCIAVGTDEWNLASLGDTAVRRASDLYRALPRGGTPDLRFHLTRKGHTITDRDTTAAAGSFALSDLAFAAFLYADDYPEKELRGIVEQANHQQPAAAATALARVLARTSLAEPLRTKAQALGQLVDARLARLAAAVRSVASEDPVLAAWYGPQLMAQLKGHAEEKALKALLATAGKDKANAATLAAHAELARQFPTLFGDGGTNPTLTAEKRRLLEQLAPHLPPTSRAGAMVPELLMPPPQ
jgi:hypothetical protein